MKEISKPKILSNVERIDRNSVQSFSENRRWEHFAIHFMKLVIP